MTSQPRRRSALGLTITAAAVAASVTTMVVTVDAAPSGADTHVASVRHVVRSTPAQQISVAPTSNSMISAADTRVADGRVSASKNPAGVRLVAVAATTPHADASADVSPLAADGIPVTALHAYEDAAAAVATTDPQCGIPWPLLAGIGRVESDHGRFAGATLYTDGTASAKILGPVLDGNGNAVIRDTDDGSLDGNASYDRAMGPMQFIPSTWDAYASDGNGDGIADPFNIFDETLAAAKYLCAAGGDLTTTAGQVRAVYAYNHLDSYVRLVLGLEHAYATGAGVVVPDPPPAPRTEPVTKKPVTKPVTAKPVTAKPVTAKPVTKPVSTKPVTTTPVTPVKTPTAPVSPPSTTTPPTTTAPPTTATPPTTLACPTGTQPIPVTTPGTSTTPAPLPTGSQPATATTLNTPNAVPTSTVPVVPAPGTAGAPPQLMPDGTPVPVGCMLIPVTTAPTSTG